MAKRSVEVAAREARAAALKHLEATGSGPSQYELGNPSNGLQQGLERGDNTLQMLVARQARTHPQQVGSSLSQKKPLAIPRSATAKSSSKDGKAPAIKANGCKKVADRGLPRGWQQAIDPTSGDVYYWNELTQETSWTVPKSTKEEGDEEEMKELPPGWQMVLDPTSNSVYYWNMHTHETQWERPVSFEQAIEAKSKLDQVLRGLKHDREEDVESDTNGPTKKTKADEDATFQAFLDDVNRVPMNLHIILKMIAPPTVPAPLPTLPIEETSSKKETDSTSKQSHAESNPMHISNIDFIPFIV